MATLLVLIGVCLYAAYWVVRSGVSHGMQEALRKDALNRIELDERLGDRSGG